MKWSCAEDFLSPEAAAADPLPMWLADMDFRVPDVVTEALHQAVAHGIFGYVGGVPDDYLAAVTGWQRRRFGWEVAPEWVVPVPGVITAIKTIMQAFSAVGDSILIQPPVYAHFHEDVHLNGRHVTAAPLVRRGDRFAYDPEVFEAAILPDTKLFLLSNPHNPTGNVWTRDELTSMGEICARHGVLVVSDEIHQDLIMNPALSHTPFASLGDAFSGNSITCFAASKTFNVPGLQCANMVVPDPRRRAELLRQYERNIYPMVNTLGMTAATAAYSGGEAWLEAMLDYVRENHRVFATAINQAGVGLQVMPADALFLAWIDCTALGLEPEDLAQFMLTQARVWMDNGPRYGAGGAGFMRINLGCPRAQVLEAAVRIVEAVRRRQAAN